MFFLYIKKLQLNIGKQIQIIIDWGGMTDVENIRQFLYNDATIFLERKKKTFDRVYNMNKTNTKYRKK